MSAFGGITLATEYTEGKEGAECLCEIGDIDVFLNGRIYAPLSHVVKVKLAN